MNVGAPKVMSAIAEVRPITGCIGAEITGIDLNTLAESQVAAIRAAFVQHQVLFFPGQDLSPDALFGFAGLFGEVEPLRFGMKHHAKHPKVLLLESRDGGGPGKYNDTWHSDRSCLQCPPAATVIQARTIPERGGDTLFASMYAAYESLSEPIRAMLDGMEALHDAIPVLTPYLLDDSMPNGRLRLEHLRNTSEVSTHPLVKYHPDTGRKLLFLNRTYTIRILGLSDIESRHLLALLFAHIEQPSFQMRWQWNEGDVCIWDNRCTLHYAAKDYGRALRVMERVTVKSEGPQANRQPES